MRRVRRDVRRRLDQFVANPSCEANIRSAVHDIPMLAVARAEGFDPLVGQSPFAIVRGQMFEKKLFEDEALALGRALVKAGVLPASASGFVDLRLKGQGGAMLGLVDARDAFYDLLEDFAEREGEALADIPCMIAAPALQIPGRSILPDGLFAIDVVTVHPRERPAPIELRIGEIKVYPDRGGYTDSKELAETRAQAGVYLYGLRLAIEKLGLGERIAVSDKGFLVLTYPGTSHPSVRGDEDLRWQAARAEATFERLREAAARELPIDTGDKDEVPSARLDYIREAAVSYQESCWSFCERAERCHLAAEDKGDGLVLGEEVARLLGTIPLPRAVALLNGEAPTNDAERDFLQRAEASRALRDEEAA